jgi:hypothetical protein
MNHPHDQCVRCQKQKAQPMHFLCAECYAQHDGEPRTPTGVEARVCDDIAARQRLGIAKYGVTVEQSPDDMLRHAYEEALDLAVYLKAEMKRRKP